MNFLHFWLFKKIQFENEKQNMKWKLNSGIVIKVWFALKQIIGNKKKIIPLQNKTHFILICFVVWSVSQKQSPDSFSSCRLWLTGFCFTVSCFFLCVAGFQLNFLSQCWREEEGFHEGKGKERVIYISAWEMMRKRHFLCTRSPSVWRWYLSAEVPVRW